MESFRALMDRDAERCSGDGLCGTRCCCGMRFAEVETTVAMTAKDAAALFESAGKAALHRWGGGRGDDNDIATSAAHARADARTCSVGRDPSADVTSSRVCLPPSSLTNESSHRVSIPLV